MEMEVSNLLGHDGYPWRPIRYRRHRSFGIFIWWTVSLIFLATPFEGICPVFVGFDGGSSEPNYCHRSGCLRSSMFANAVQVTFKGLSMQYLASLSKTDGTAPFLQVFQPDPGATASSSRTHLVLNSIVCSRGLEVGMSRLDGHGYLLSITFVDGYGRVLAAFGNNLTSPIELPGGHASSYLQQPISFPSLGQVRVRYVTLQPLREIIIDMSRKPFLSLESGNNISFVHFQTSSTEFRNDTIHPELKVSYSFTCTSGPLSHHRNVHVRVTSGMYNQTLTPDMFTVYSSYVPQLIAVYALFTKGSVLDPSVPAEGYLDLYGVGDTMEWARGSKPDLGVPIHVTYRCISIQRPMAIDVNQQASLTVDPSLYTVPNSSIFLVPPFVLLSDVDGAASTHSLMPHMEVNGVQEFPILQENTCGSRRFLQVQSLSAALTPGMNDYTWGSPGYRTIFSMINNNGSPMVSLSGSASLHRLELPDLLSFRLRAWHGQSSGGFIVRVECPDVDQVELQAFRAAEENMTIIAAEGGIDTRVLLPPNSSVVEELTCPSTVLGKGGQVLLSLNSRTLPIVVGVHLVSVGTEWMTVTSLTAPTSVALSRNGSMKVRSLLTNMSIPLTFRCVYPYWVGGASRLGVTSSAVLLGTRQVVRLPAFIRSDVDLGGGTSMLSYPDAAPETIWEIHEDDMSSCSGPYRVPHLRVLEYDMQPNMVDGTWGTPGYRTIFAFLDHNGTLIASFGDAARQHITNVSLPQLKYIRLRLWGGWSSAGFTMELYCKHVNTTDNNVAFVNSYFAPSTALVQDAEATHFRCDDSSAQIELAFPFIDSAVNSNNITLLKLLVDLVRSRLVGAALLFDTDYNPTRSAQQRVTVVSPTSFAVLEPISESFFGLTWNVRHRCVFLHRPCGSGLINLGVKFGDCLGGRPLPLRFPAVIVSDADGPYATSFASYPDIADLTEWSVATPGGRPCKDQGTTTPSGQTGVGPYIFSANVSMRPSMQDGTWGTPGYRTILSFFGNASVDLGERGGASNLEDSSVLLMSLGNEARTELFFVALPSLQAIRFRKWFGQSASGFSLDLRCAEDDLDLVSVRQGHVPLALEGAYNEQRFFSVSPVQGSTYTVSCPSLIDVANPRHAVEMRVEFDLRTNTDAALRGVIHSASVELFPVIRFINATFVASRFVATDPSLLIYSATRVASVVVMVPSMPFSLQIGYRCVFLHRPRALGGSPMAPQPPMSLRYPAVILSDADGHHATSWASYADLAPLHTWIRTLNSTLRSVSDPFAGPALVNCDPTNGSFPEVTSLQMSMTPGMQDTTWGSPGYRTVLSFHDEQDTTLTSFGHTTVRLANVSLPALSSIVLRLWFQQSAPGFALHLQCRQRCTTPDRVITLESESHNVLVPRGSCTRFRCTPGASVRLRVADLNNNSFSQMDRIIGAALVSTSAQVELFSTTLDGLVDVDLAPGVVGNLSSSIRLAADCVYVYIGCRATRMHVRLPAVIISDVDGNGDTSWTFVGNTQAPACNYSFADYSPSPYFSGDRTASLGRIGLIRFGGFAQRPAADPLGVDAIALPARLPLVINGAAASNLGVLLKSSHVIGITILRRGIKLSDSGFQFEVIGVSDSLSASLSSTMVVSQLTSTTSASNYQGTSSKSRSTLFSQSLRSQQKGRESHSLSNTYSLECNEESVPELQLWNVFSPDVAIRFRPGDAQDDGSRMVPAFGVVHHDTILTTEAFRCGAASLTTCGSNHTTNVSSAVAVSVFFDTTRSAAAFARVDRSQLLASTIREGRAPESVVVEVLIALQPPFFWEEDLPPSGPHVRVFLSSPTSTETVDVDGGNITSIMMGNVSFVDRQPEEGEDVKCGRFVCCALDAEPRLPFQWLNFAVTLSRSRLMAVATADTLRVRLSVPLGSIRCGSPAYGVRLPRPGIDFKNPPAGGLSSSANTNSSSSRPQAEQLEFEVRLFDPLGAPVSSPLPSGAISSMTIGTMTASSSVFAALTGNPTLALSISRAATLRTLMNCNLNRLLSADGIDGTLSSADAHVSQKNSSYPSAGLSWSSNEEKAAGVTQRYHAAVEVARVDNIMGWVVSASPSTSSTSSTVERVYGDVVRGGVVGNMILLIGFVAVFSVSTLVVLFCMVWRRFTSVLAVSTSSTMALSSGTALSEALRCLLNNRREVLQLWSAAVHTHSIFGVPLSILLVPTVQCLVKLWFELPSVRVDVLAATVSSVLLVGLLWRWILVTIASPSLLGTTSQGKVSPWYSFLLEGRFVCRLENVSQQQRCLQWVRFQRLWLAVVGKGESDDVSQQLPSPILTVGDLFRRPLCHSIFYAVHSQQHWVATKQTLNNNTSVVTRETAQSTSGSAAGSPVDNRIWKRQNLLFISEFRYLGMVHWELGVSCVAAVSNGAVQAYLLQHNSYERAVCVLPIAILLAYYSVTIVLYVWLLPSFVPLINRIALTTGMCGFVACVGAILVLYHSSEDGDPRLAATATDVTLAGLMLISSLGYLRALLDLKAAVSGVRQSWKRLQHLADSMVSLFDYRKNRTGGPTRLTVVDLCGAATLDDNGTSSSALLRGPLFLNADECHWSDDSDACEDHGACLFDNRLHPPEGAAASALESDAPFVPLPLEQLGSISSLTSGIFGENDLLRAYQVARPVDDPHPSKMDEQM